MARNYMVSDYWRTSMNKVKILALVLVLILTTGGIVFLLSTEEESESGFFEVFNDSMLYSNAKVEEEYVIYINEDVVNILSKRDLRIFNLFLDKSLSEYVNDGESKSKIERLLYAENNVTESDYVFSSEDIGILIRNNGEVIVYTGTKEDKIKGQVRGTSLVPSLDTAMDAFKRASEDYPELPKLFTTNYECMVLDRENQMYHIYLKDGNSLSIVMYKDVELLIEPINIIDALRLASTIDISILELTALKGYEGQSFEFLAPLGDGYIVGVSTTGSQFMYDMVRGSYKILSIN